MNRWLDALLVVFIVFKLAGLVAWSWWVVLSPLWVALLVGFAAGVICNIIQVFRNGH